MFDKLKAKMARKKEIREYLKNGGKEELIEMAKEQGLPLMLKSRYLYALGTEEPMTLPKYKKWQKFMEANGINVNKSWAEMQRPAKANEKFIGTYMVYSHYRDRDYNSMGDYAMGDSGYNGDLVLVRIDEI